MNSNNIIRYNINYFYKQRFNNKKKLPNRVLKILNMNTKINMKIDEEKLKVLEKNKNNFNKEQLEKKINSNLNKLSKENFDNIYILVNTILKEREDILLEYTIKNLLNKAINQPIFCELYAKFYKKFYNNKTQKIFLNVFNDLISLLENKLNCENDKNYNELCRYIKDKNRFIGLFIFISSLYKLKIIKNKHIKYYIDYLIKKIKENNEDLEKYFETLCKFLTNIENKDLINDYLDILSTFKDYKLGMRYKFMLTDLFDLYKKL